MDMFRIGQWGEAQKYFKAVFKTDITPFYDGQMTVLFGKICINIYKFDDYLHDLYGDYEKNGFCMNYIVLKHYGSHGVELLNKLL